MKGRKAGTDKPQKLDIGKKLFEDFQRAWFEEHEETVIRAEVKRIEREHDL